MEIEGIEVLDSEELGAGGFLVLRRYSVQNIRRDGSRSRPYKVDMVDRPAGIDAVVVLPFALNPTRVLLRRCLRPVTWLGRGHQHSGNDDAQLWLVEAVAGLVEPGESTTAGLRERAAQELLEEAGLRVDSERIEALGPAVFVSSGVIAERLHFFCVEAHLDRMSPSAGDGSPMEEGGMVSEVDLQTALASCDSGDIHDLKTECAVRRLAQRLR